MRNTAKKGFTLVETLVAIAVLMIAVVGPLTVANKAYRAAVDAKNQTVAYNLAQEGLEYLNNLKDNWNGNGHPSFFETCGSSCSFPSIPNIVDVPAPFSRSYYIQTVDYSQVIATVIVTWQTGTVGNKVQLQQVLTDVTR